MNDLPKQPTDALIRSLSSGLPAVVPLRPPIARALLWLACIALLTAPLVLWLADLAVFRARNSDPRFALELAATLITGLVAVIAAFYLSIPGRSERWRYAPLPSLLVWLACSGFGCVANGLGRVNLDCVVFVLAASVPLSLLLFTALRMAKPIAPLRVAIMASLGVAGIAAFLLQFFHPFDVTVIDLGLHLLSVALIMSMAATAGRRALTFGQTLVQAAR
jgi:hypothetical protein